jgi:hypothetical protein
MTDGAKKIGSVANDLQPPLNPTGNLESNHWAYIEGQSFVKVDMRGTFRHKICRSDGTLEVTVSR